MKMMRMDERRITKQIYVANIMENFKKTTQKDLHQRICPLKG